MGAATAGIYGGSEHGSKNVDAIVLDSSFESMKSMLLAVWEDNDTGLPSNYAVWSGNIILKNKYGFSFDDADVSLALKSCKVPVLIIQSEKDNIATNEMGEKLFSVIPHNNKAIWKVNSDHIKGYFDYPVEYKETISNFIKEYL